MPKYLQIYERYWASALHTFRGLCIGACRGNSYINSEKGMLAEGKTKCGEQTFGKTWEKQIKLNGLKTNTNNLNENNKKQVVQINFN